MRFLVCHPREWSLTILGVLTGKGFFSKNLVETDVRGRIERHN
jgi:hypothetical protein